MKQLKRYAQWFFRCLLTGEVTPIRKRRVIRQTFTENVWFNKQLRSVHRITRRNTIKEFSNG